MANKSGKRIDCGVLAANTHEAKSGADCRKKMTYLGLFTVSFLAATILPGSSEVLLLVLAYQDPDQIVALFVVATIGNTAGAVVNWALGRWALNFAGSSWFPFDPININRASEWFKKYGSWSLLLSWAPVFGDLLTVAAGALRIPILPFIILAAIGKAGRYAALLGAFDAIRAWLAL